MQVPERPDIKIVSLATTNKILKLNNGIKVPEHPYIKIVSLATIKKTLGLNTVTSVTIIIIITLAPLIKLVDLSLTVLILLT